MRFLTISKVPFLISCTRAFWASSALRTCAPSGEILASTKDPELIEIVLMVDKSDEFSRYICDSVVAAIKFPSGLTSIETPWPDN